MGDSGGLAVGPEAAGKALLHCAAHPGAPCVGLLLGPRAGEATDAAPLAHTLSAAATSPALETAIAQVGVLPPCSRSPRIAAVREGGERGEGGGGGWSPPPLLLETPPRFPDRPAPPRLPPSPSPSLHPSTRASR